MKSPAVARILRYLIAAFYIVGAAEDGECALYDRAAGAYERLHIFA